MRNITILYHILSAENTLKLSRDSSELSRDCSESCIDVASRSRDSSESCTDGV
jgi:hypothetical protein